jgi:4-amino-4-deoxy-L-arabinose transferase-like glycosyltransferase
VGTFRNHKEILVILLISAVIVLAAGLTSDVYVGDEVHHYRFAKDMFAAGKRVAFDPLYGSGNPPGYFYSSEPLWSGVLAVLWRLIGRVSFSVAQVYHTVYYLFLIFLTYLLGIELYGKKEGIYSASLVASAPMIVSFSILFYLDVAGAAFVALSLLLLLKKNYWGAGLGIALIYFTRRNGCFLVPGFIVILFLGDERFWFKLKNLILLILPTVFLGLWDMHWRRVHIEDVRYTIPGIGQFSSVTIGDYLKARVTKLLFGTGEYLNSSLTHPADIVKYFGIVLLVSLILYFFFKKGKRRDQGLWICIAFYSVLFAFLFGFNSDIRYLLPMIPLLCLLGASALGSRPSSKWTKGLIGLVCLTQLLGTSFYVHRNRQIPAGLKEGFRYITMNTSKEALFMYPGYSFIEATGRRFVWSSFFQVETWKMKNRYAALDVDKVKSGFMFWTKNPEDAAAALQLNHLDYIVIDKSRIYDDTRVQHFGGYPASFTRRLPQFLFMTKVFENERMCIWKVNLDEKGPNSLGKEGG